MSDDTMPATRHSLETAAAGLRTLAVEHDGATCSWCKNAPLRSRWRGFSAQEIAAHHVQVMNDEADILEADAKGRV